MSIQDVSAPKSTVLSSTVSALPRAVYAIETASVLIATTTQQMHTKSIMQNRWLTTATQGTFMEYLPMFQLEDALVKSHHAGKTTVSATGQE